MRAATAWIVTAFLAPAAFGAQAGIDAERLRLAADWSAANRGISMLVMVDGRIVFEDYPNGGSATRAHELASGTKSFSGVMAVAAAQDGLLRLDEKVAGTLPEWRKDRRKARITLRQLLSLTSGLETGVANPPTYAEAIAKPVVDSPGTTFTYGATAFQVFGEVMRRKLAPRGEDPLAYLKRRIFDPIGLTVGRWRRGSDGNPQLPSGAALTAREWAKFGELVRRGGTWGGQRLLDRKLLDQCFEGTPQNPAYGLTWWLNREVPPALRRTIPILRRQGLGQADLWVEQGLPADLVIAGGAGDQRLYVSREQKLVVVRQAEGILDSLFGGRTGFTDHEFLARLLLGQDAAGRDL